MGQTNWEICPLGKKLNVRLIFLILIFYIEKRFKPLRKIGYIFQIETAADCHHSNHKSLFSWKSQNAVI